MTPEQRWEQAWEELGSHVEAAIPHEAIEAALERLSPDARAVVESLTGLASTYLPAVEHALNATVPRLIREAVAEERAACVRIAEQQMWPYNADDDPGTMDEPARAARLIARGIQAREAENG